MPRTVTNYSAGIRFIADVDSMDALAGGCTLNIAAFTDAKFGAAGQRYIPAGTAVKLDGNGLGVPADATGPAYITASDVLENGFFLRGSDTTTGLYVGGVVYQDRLFDADNTGALPAPIKAALGVKFTYQTSPGVLTAF